MDLELTGTPSTSASASRASPPRAASIVDHGEHGIVVTEGVEALYRVEAERQGWGSSWPEIEAGALRDVLPNSVGRLGRTEEIADLVAYLASPRAGYVTGANFRSDGGSTTIVN